MKWWLTFQTPVASRTVCTVTTTTTSWAAARTYVRFRNFQNTFDIANLSKISALGMGPNFLERNYPCNGRLSGKPSSMPSSLTFSFVVVVVVAAAVAFSRSLFEHFLVGSDSANWQRTETSWTSSSSSAWLSQHGKEEKMPMVRARVAVRQHWCSTLIDPLLYHLKK